MKLKILFATLALTVCTPTMANDEFCASVSMLAEKVMTGRQAGVPLTEQIAIASDSKLIRMIVIDAYDKPAMSLPENQIKQTRDFQNHWALECYKNRGND